MSIEKLKKLEKSCGIFGEVLERKISEDFTSDLTWNFRANFTKAIEKDIEIKYDTNTLIINLTQLFSEVCKQ